MRAASALVIAMLLASCGAQTTAPAMNPAAASAASARVDAVFAEKGCAIPAPELDAALAAGPDAQAANEWLAGAMARKEFTLALARPASIITSHRGACA